MSPQFVAQKRSSLRKQKLYSIPGKVANGRSSRPLPQGRQLTRIAEMRSEMYELHKQVDESFKRFADASKDGKECIECWSRSEHYQEIRKVYTQTAWGTWPAWRTWEALDQKKNFAVSVVRSFLRSWERASDTKRCSSRSVVRICFCRRACQWSSHRPLSEGARRRRNWTWRSINQRICLSKKGRKVPDKRKGCIECRDVCARCKNLQFDVVLVLVSKRSCLWQGRYILKSCKNSAVLGLQVEAPAGKLANRAPMDHLFGTHGNARTSRSMYQIYLIRHLKSFEQMGPKNNYF